MNRLKEVQSRFDATVESLTAVHGKDKAHCAAVMAHMCALDAIVKTGLRHTLTDSERAELAQEVHQILMSISADICLYLKVDPREIIRLAKHFEQILRDLFKGVPDA